MIPVRALVATFLAAMLAACSSMSGLSPGPRTAFAAIDPLNDDVAGMVVALDLPDSLSPGRDGPRLRYGTGASALDLTYSFGDAEAVMNALPEPPEGRRYVVYALTLSDREKVRAAQGSGAVALAVEPRFCATSAMNRDRDSVGILGILPDRRVVTLAPRETVAAFEARSGTAVAPCT